ncbi:M56 family metallopeptidase [Hymenobacter rubidus]|uniref:M56 family metallopeptidase n=1 Tax=Hymenobacter rubidus TaxID=1441626 RepID=UPI00191DC8CE|nr:M56 family metallopeptidase [Hymenobacter rubidus]
MLSPTLLYLLKANGALLLFAVAYFGLLRRLTFFRLNRFYLLFALLFSAVYPALPVPALLPPVAAAPVAVVLMDTATGTAAEPAAALSAPIDWDAVALAVYGTGVALGLLRLLMQLLSLAQLRRRSRPAVVLGVAVRALPGDVSPFSFWRTIYLNPAQHPGAELAAVLRHEQVHVRQWHTLDVLLAHVAQAAAWCNPAAWLLRRALLDNLEYLADRAVLEAGLDRRAYQYSLLRLSHGVAGPSLVSHFTFPTLKNRVLMMNLPASTTAQLGRYLLALALTLGPALGFAAARAQRAVAAPGPVAYYVDGKLSDKAAFDKLNPDGVAYLNILDEEKARRIFGKASGKVAIAVTKQNQNSSEVLALNAKIASVAPFIPGTAAPAEVNVLTPKALAYITKTYPNSRIIGVTKLTYPSTKQTRYKVELAEGTRPHYTFFDEKGNPVKPGEM